MTMTKKERELAKLISIPRYFPGEESAIRMVVAAAEEYGYGNLIDRLKDAWSEKMQKHGFTREQGDRVGGHICPWCSVDGRTGKKVGAGRGE